MKKFYLYDKFYSKNFFGYIEIMDSSCTDFGKTVESLWAFLKINTPLMCLNIFKNFQAMNLCGNKNGIEMNYYNYIFRNNIHSVVFPLVLMECCSSFITTELLNLRRIGKCFALALLPHIAMKLNYIRIQHPFDQLRTFPSKITSNELLKHLNGKQEYCVAVFVYSKMCTPSKEMEEPYEKLKAKHEKTNILFFKLEVSHDADDSHCTAYLYSNKITLTPSFLFHKQKTKFLIEADVVKPSLETFQKFITL